MLERSGAKPKVEAEGFDLAFEHRGERCFLELETAPANWQAEGAEPKHKRISSDLDAVEDDLAKVVSKVRPPHQWGMVAFSMFPVPLRVLEDERSTLRQHIHRIEAASRLSRGALEWEYAPAPSAGECGVVFGVVAPFKQEFSRVLDRIVQGYEPEAVYLYGSFAWGEPHLDSDFDLLVIKETNDRPIDRRVAVARIVSRDAGRVPVEAVVLTPQELAARHATGDPFVREMVERGTLLYARPAGVAA